jgi:hypothetical protein
VSRCRPSQESGSDLPILKAWVHALPLLWPTLSLLLAVLNGRIHHPEALNATGLQHLAHLTSSRASLHIAIGHYRQGSVPLAAQVPHRGPVPAKGGQAPTEGSNSCLRPLKNGGRYVLHSTTLLPCKVREGHWHPAGAAYLHFRPLSPQEGTFRNSRPQLVMP